MKMLSNFMEQVTYRLFGAINVIIHGEDNYFERESRHYYNLVSKKNKQIMELRNRLDSIGRAASASRVNRESN